MKQEIEEIIKKNLPEKKEPIAHQIPCPDNMPGCCVYHCEYRLSNEDKSFNQALSQINTSLIADEVLRVVVEKIIETLTSDITHSVFGEGWLEKWQVLPTRGVEPCIDCDNGNKIRTLLSNLSPNKENK